MQGPCRIACGRTAEAGLPMKVLGFESSCDETGVALVETARRRRRRGCWPRRCTARSTMHAAYGGVVPELASRDHIRRVLPLARQVLADAGCTLGRRRPRRLHARPRSGRGAAGRRRRGGRAGRRAGQAGAGRAPPRRPSAVAVPRPTTRREFPFVALLVSGGHTQLMQVDGVGRYATARRDHRRRRRRGLRQERQAARAWATRAGRRWRGWPSSATRRLTRCRGRCCTAATSTSRSPG